MNSASLLARLNFAVALSQGKIPGVKVDVGQFTGDASLIERRLLFTDASAEAQAAIQVGWHLVGLRSLRIRRAAVRVFFLSLRCRHLERL